MVRCHWVRKHVHQSDSAGAPTGQAATGLRRMQSYRLRTVGLHDATLPACIVEGDTQPSNTEGPKGTRSLQLPLHGNPAVKRRNTGKKPGETVGGAQPLPNRAEYRGDPPGWMSLSGPLGLQPAPCRVHWAPRVTCWGASYAFLLMQRVEHDVQADPRGILARVAGALEGLVPLEGAAQVIPREDHHVAVA